MNSTMVSYPWSWRQKPDGAAPYVALLGYVQLASWRSFPRFAWFGMLTVLQLRRTKGVVGYRTASHFARREFYHLSAWKSHEQIRDYVGAEPHLSAMREMTGKFARTEFRTWGITGADLPLRIDRELVRVNRGTPVATLG